MYPAFLHEVGEHDDAARVSLPDQPPEVIGGVGQGALSGNVGTLPLISLNVVNRKEHNIIPY